ncbi:signal transduction histidine kinase [Stackebrandtia endophytica]|uniref:Signal transduction histidine kinase n=2 Tax=Stackebrandtia endophytica TaxID=1496996 RepID=A0A543AVQ2_9ACTN|nr:signal transduction histidine kinase [Stackebrandtia endophytica]
MPPVPTVVYFTHDHWHGCRLSCSNTLGWMKNFGADVWSGVVGSLISVVIGIPIIVMGVSGDAEFAVPVWLWTIGFAILLALQLTCMWLMDVLPRRIILAVFTGQVVLGPILVLLVPRAGWIPVLLVFTAAMSSYLLTPTWSYAIIGLNTATVTVASLISGGDFVEMVIVAAIYALLQLVSVLSTFATLRESRMRRELATAHTELGAASALLAESTRAEERLRISRELHDLVGHQLTALTLELEVARHKANPPVVEHVDRARSVARELLADVRVAVGQLRSSAPDLRETLERIVADLPEPKVHLLIDPEVSVDEQTATTLVRCGQEIITNAIRHARATELWIQIQTDEDGALTLTATDDGLAQANFVLGNGLRGMTERIEALGGRVRFWVDGGFRVAATVPAT